MYRVYLREQLLALFYFKESCDFFVACYKEYNCDPNALKVEKVS